MDNVILQAEVKHLLSATGKSHAAPLTVEPELHALHTPSAQCLETLLGYP